MAGSSGGIVTEECLSELLVFFARNAYRAKANNVDRRYEIIHKMCLHMVARDYNFEVVDNKGGQLCGHYPSELIILVSHMEQQGSDIHVKANDVSKLKELFTAARFARCRSRFIVPVILYRNKNICRSATLSTMAELYGRSGMDMLVTGGEGTQGVDSPVSSSESATANGAGVSNDSELIHRVRGQDVQLLKALRVSLICDLMVENKKIKYGIPVSSSEKVDKWARYADFCIASLPYPGCEFFKEYRDNGWNPTSLFFDWNQPGMDAIMVLPDTLEGVVPYKKYKQWDLVQITQNYLKLLLHNLRNSNNGILIHCISGWDRTPMFITLLRLLLWADGEAHQSLTPSEILYFTLAFDWLLYGHQLKERREKGEEILYFCFDFLKYLTSDDFSVKQTDRHRSEESSNGRVSSGGLDSSADSWAFSNTGDDGSWVQIDHPPVATTACNMAIKAREPSTPKKEDLPGSWSQLTLEHFYNSEQTSPFSQHSAAPNGTQHARHQSPRSPHTTSPPEGSRSSSQASSSDRESPRAEKLLKVRQLFLTTYRSSVMDQGPDQGARNITRTFGGLLSRIANSL